MINKQLDGLSKHFAKFRTQDIWAKYCPVGLKFVMRLCSSADPAPVNFESGTNTIVSNLEVLL